jgi:hypothetical protein
VGGYGTIGGSILSSGLLNPFVDGTLGSQLGDINITGNYTETDAAQINIQIGGEDRGTEYDAIDISGIANFDGTINVSLINDFFPVLGDQFDIITYSSYTGDTELDFTGLILGNGLRLNPIFSDTGLSLVVGTSNAPNAQSDAYGTYQGQGLTINVAQGLLANDTHPDNDTVTVSLRDNAQFGSVSLNPNGSFTYTPNPGFLGTDTFTYTATDSDGDFDIATVTINVTAPPADLAPIVANPLSGVYVLPNATDSIIDLSNVFTDADDDDSLIAKTILTNSNNSLVTANITGNQLTLSYLADQIGQANITIQALSDGQTVNETFTVFVQASGTGGDGDQAPVVANHIPAAIVQLNAANSIIDISTVFTDPDNDDALIVKSIQSVSNPNLFDSVDLTDNLLTLDYAADQYGAAYITVLGESNGKTVTDLFTVYVQSPDIDNAPFVLNPLADLNRQVNATTEIINLSAVFSDVDNDDALIMKALFGNTNPDVVNASINGNQLRLDYSDTLQGTTDITIWAFSNGKLIQDMFTITVENGLPFVANPIADQSVNEGVAFSLDLSNVFSDPDGETLTYSFAKPHWLTFDETTKTLSGTPGNGQVGTVTITVSATDSDGIATDQFNLTVVDQPNGTFVIENATYSVDETAPTLSVTILRQGGDLGEVGVRLATQNVTAISPDDYNGEVFNLTFADGETSKTVEITINDDIVPEGGANKTPETFNLILSNVSGGAQLGTQSNAVVSIIDDEPVVTPPVAVNDVKGADALDIITIDVLGNDYDPDNYRLPLELHRLTVDGVEYDPYAIPTITTNLGGIISIFNNNTPGDRTDDQLYYTAPDVDAVEIFTYTIRDGNLASDFISDPATVSITITPDPRTETDNFNLTINGNTVNYTSAEVESFSDQDLNGTFALYDQNAIDLDGNTWKAIALKDYGYTGGYVIGTDTTLTFDFKSSAIGEIQGLAWATENLSNTNISPDNVLNIYGSNTGYGLIDFDYSGAGQWQTISVNLSEYDNGIMNYLVFVGDDDANNKGDSQFRNVILNQTTTNRRPTDITLSSNTVDEEQAIGVTVGTLSTTDLDSNDEHIYTLVEGQGDDNNALFTIENNQLKTNSVFDYETQTNYSILIKTTDLGGISQSKIFIISITNVNEAPVIGSSATTNFAENGIGTVYTVTATDPEGTTPIYGLAETGDYALFDIDSSKGIVTFKMAPDYENPSDSGTNNIYDLTVTASDGLLSDSQAVAITVTNVEDTSVYVIVESVGNTSLVKNGENQLFSQVGSNTPITINRNGIQIYEGYSGWSFLAAETVNSVNQALVKNSSLGVRIWNFDSNWDYVSVKGVATSQIYNQETIFGVDADGDGSIGNPNPYTTVESAGNTALIKNGENQLFSQVGSNTPITINRNGIQIYEGYSGWSFLAAETVNSVNQALVKNSSLGVRIWNFDSNWDYVSVKGVATSQIYNQETIFGVDTDGDGSIGNPNSLNLTGTSGNDTLIGGANSDVLTGLGGKDSLTGGLGSDRFGYKILTDSLLSNFDVIKDFNANADNDLFLVTTVRSSLTNAGSIATLDNTGIIAKLTTANFGANSAAQFTFGTRSFVAINDAEAGFSQTTDAIIEVTGLTGTLTTTNFVIV